MNEMAELFDFEKIIPDKFCRTCVHRERHQCGSMVIQYCGARKSNRTDNGKLKIKCKTIACNLYKHDTPDKEHQKKDNPAID